MKYMKLDQKGSVLAEYVWIDGTNGLRSKTKVRSQACLIRIHGTSTLYKLYPWRNFLAGIVMGEALIVLHADKPATFSHAGLLGCALADSNAWNRKRKSR